MWQICLCVGFAFLLLETFVPGLFFLNFAFAAFLCAIIAIFIQDVVILGVIFCVLSILLLFTLRPLLIRQDKGEKQKTGMDEKYVGKNALVIENVDRNSGVISIYDERWQARNVEDGIIEKGTYAEIVGYESITMKVKKTDK